MMAIEDNIVDEIQPPDSQVDTADIIQAPDDMGLDMSEGTEVAGVGKGAAAIRKAIKQGQNETLETIQNKPDASVKPIMEKKKEPVLESKKISQDTTVFPEADKEIADDVVEKINIRKAEKNVTGKAPKQEFNFDVINENNLSGENISAVIGGFSDSLGIKTKKVSFDQIKEKANELGIDEKFINRVVEGGKEFKGDAVQVYRAMQLLEVSAKELDTQMLKAAQGQATEMDLLKLRQQITLHGLIQKGVKGIQTNTARALAIMRVKRDTSNINVVQKILDETGGANSLQDLARSYIKVQDRSAKNNLLEKTMFNSTVDVWLTTWINGLLSAPTTHAKNIFGNTLFAIYQSPERLVAAGFSKALDKLNLRKEIIKSDKRFLGIRIPKLSDEAQDELVEMGEFITDAQSLKLSFIEGFNLAGKAWKTNNPSDPLSKIELRGNPDIAEDIKNISEGLGLDVSEGTWIGKGIDLYGTAVQIPGRALLSEDEFFKGVMNRMGLNRLISRRTNATFRNAIKNGLSEDEAIALAQKETLELYKNPPDELSDAAREEAKVSTFTNELPPLLKGLEQSIFRNPIVKTIVPFFRTPSNIAMQVLERTPFAPLVSSRYRADLVAGGVRRDLALAKVTMGSSLLATFAMVAQDGFMGVTMTGRGAGRKNDRQALIRSGWRPYSIVLNGSTDGLSDEAKKTFAMLEKRGLASKGKNKIYISYSGFEPMSAFFAMASDYADYARYNENDSETQQVFYGALAGMFNFLSEQPFLTGISDISKAIMGGDSYGDDIDRAEAVINALAKQGTTAFVGGSPLGFQSSMIASIERINDPTATDVTVKGLDLPVGVKGFYEALNRYKSRIPFFNDDLPPRLNLWGEPVQSGQGKVYEMFTPLRISTEQMSYVDSELVSIGSTISMPSRVITFDNARIELTPTQYNEFIGYYNEPFNEGGLTAKAEFFDLMIDDFYQNSTLYEKQEEVKDLHRSLLQKAKDDFVRNNKKFLQKEADLHQKNIEEKGLFYDDR
tara:strand:+ start:711 stop:3740 length:3030 start_codon:yes stop_codon:yes gene_type:complete